MKIAMWSGPRNLSTAMMYAFAQRPGCVVWDEPFYAPYLAATGAQHPMREEILAAHETDPAKVAARCDAPIPQDQSLFYMKHMPHHMARGFLLDWTCGCANVFLIRHPARVVASYSQKRESPTADDLGYAQQAALFDKLAEVHGRAPIVVDSTAIRADPRRVLERLCTALGLSFVERMLSWEAGPKPYDGAWAPHWYDAVWRSTGFAPPDTSVPSLSDAERRLVEAALPAYDHVAQFAL